MEDAESTLLLHSRGLKNNTKNNNAGIKLLLSILSIFYFLLDFSIILPFPSTSWIHIEKGRLNLVPKKREKKKQFRMVPVPEVDADWKQGKLDNERYCRHLLYT